MNSGFIVIQRGAQSDTLEHGSQYCAVIIFEKAAASAATLANALRRRRTVSVCAGLKRAKRGRFAYFTLKLALVPLRFTPGFFKARLRHLSPDSENFQVAGGLSRSYQHAGSRQRHNGGGQPS